MTFRYIEYRIVDFSGIIEMWYLRPILFRTIAIVYVSVCEWFGNSKMPETLNIIREQWRIFESILKGRGGKFFFTLRAKIYLKFIYFFYWAIKLWKIVYIMREKQNLQNISRALISPPKLALAFNTNRRARWNILFNHRTIQKRNWLSWSGNVHLRRLVKIFGGGLIFIFYTNRQQFWYNIATFWGDCGRFW